jgi:hypothetical protein
MGQNQIFIILIGAILIGIAILGGLGAFSDDEVDANKKVMVNDVQHIGANAARYYRRITALNGGGYSYMGYVLPNGYRSNLNGSYSTNPLSKTVLQISGVSTRDSNNTMVAQIDTYGKASNWTFTGDFQ